MTSTITALDQCGWCGRRHRESSFVRDPDRLEYLCPEYARGRPPRRGRWNEGLDGHHRRPTKSIPT